MTAIQIFLIIYLSGWVFFYLFGRWCLRRRGGYNIMDRAVLILMGIFSWVGVFMFLLVSGVRYLIENGDKPAKW